MKLIPKMVAYAAPALFLVVLHSPAEAGKGQHHPGENASVRNVTMVKTSMANAKSFALIRRSMQREASHMTTVRSKSLIAKLEYATGGRIATTDG